MGKKLIIKGADFSANGMPGSEIIWQQQSALEDVSFAKITTTSATLGVGLKLTTALGKPINVITFKIANNISTSITYSIFKVKTGDSLDGSFTSIKDFSITSDDIANDYKKVVLDNAIVITDDSETLMVGVLNNTTSVDIPVAYQIDSSENHQYILARNTSSVVALVNNAAYFVMSYGSV